MCDLKKCPFNTQEGCTYPINHLTTGCIIADAKEQNVSLEYMINHVKNGKGLIID